MNLLLFSPEERCGERVALSGRRVRHLAEVLGAAPGTTLRAGEVGGRLGTATVLAMAGDRVELAVELDRDPPPPLPVALVLALPRPKVLRRVLQAIATMGVKRLALVAATKVEKAYWQSPFLAPEAIHDQLLLGLEQAGDTVLPEVLLRPRLRPFAEDELPGWRAAAAVTLLADPDAPGEWPTQPPAPAVLAVGPEGGWTGFELALLAGAGLVPARFGRRILRVEQAVPAMLGRWA